MAEGLFSPPRVVAPSCIPIVHRDTRASSELPHTDSRDRPEFNITPNEPILVHGLPSHFIHNNPRSKSLTPVSRNSADFNIPISLSSSENKSMQANESYPSPKGQIHGIDPEIDRSRTNSSEAMTHVQGEFIEIPLESEQGNPHKKSFSSTCFNERGHRQNCQDRLQPLSNVVYDADFLCGIQSLSDHSAHTLSTKSGNRSLENFPIHLPSVDDGLSSESEVDSPRSYKNISQYSTSPSLSSHTHHVPSTCSLPTTQSGSLINPPLVDDIWGIVDEIKRTLTSNIDMQTSSSLKTPVSLQDPEHSPSVSNTIKSTSHMASHCNTDSKILVHASVEPYSKEVAHEAEAIVGSRIPHPVAPTKSGVNRQSSGELSAHQWNFPVLSDALYSSSEDEAFSVMASSERPTHKGLKLHELASRKRTMNENNSSVQQERTVAEGVEDSVEDIYRRSQTPPSGSAPALSSLSIIEDTNSKSDDDTDQLLNEEHDKEKPVYIPELKQSLSSQTNQRLREVSIRHPDAPKSLLDGVLFRSHYLGSTQLLCERQATRHSRMCQAQEAVNRIKAPEYENQPSVPVEFFVSTERLIILNTNLKEILIDHPLQLVSYIADIGELFVLMAQRSCAAPNPDNHEPTVSSASSTASGHSSSDGSYHNCGNMSNTKPKSSIANKLVCHVLESSEARLISQSVGRAFQLAYLDYLRENGVEDLISASNLNYEDVLNQQEIFCDELAMFSDKERNKQITIPKRRGEQLGVVVVSSGWGSLLPTALLANMNPTGPAARCGQLNIGNHIISVNGQSLVGLPLTECQQVLKSCRNQTIVRLLVVDCPPVTEVLIRRPNLSYQLGFSVQDGVICSLLRGGIAERGGVRVDHRIIEINGQSVVAVPHEIIVQMLSSSIGEIHLRTMPTAVFRLLTGQDQPNYI